MTSKEKLAKSVKSDNVTYSVLVSDDTIIATKYTHTMPGFGNGYGTDFILELGVKYARTTVQCFNSTWACRGHGMNDVWIETSGFMVRAKAEHLLQKVKNALETAEDDTPDVIDIFRDFVMKIYPAYEEEIEA